MTAHQSKMALAILASLGCAQALRNLKKCVECSSFETQDTCAASEGSAIQCHWDGHTCGEHSGGDVTGCAALSDAKSCDASETPECFWYKTVQSGPQCSETEPTDCSAAGSENTCDQISVDGKG